MRRAILLFLKYPEPGHVKTRLAATVGAQEAARIYVDLVGEVCRRIPKEVALIPFFSPSHRRTEIEAWLADLCGNRPLDCHPQSLGDLGNRLTHAFQVAFQDGYDQVAVIGSDCVEISDKIFADTWQALDRGNDLIIGPSVDGGYYLLASKQLHPALFEKIDWSTGAVLEQTLARAREAHLVISLLAELHDIDTEDDWLRAKTRLKC